MKQSPKLAYRYANALYEFADAESKIENTYQDILLLKQTFHENKELKIVIESPIITPEKKSLIFTQLFSQMITPITFGFLNLIIKKRREPSLILILDAFISLYYQHHNIKIATIKTAISLSDNDLQNIRTVLEEQTQATIDIQTIIDPSIIGGFIIKLEGQLLDASLLGKINKLKMEFSKNIYQASF